MTIEMERKERLDKNLCPHCGTALEVGFGLAGGGYGAYTYCPADQCGKYFDKTQEHDGIPQEVSEVRRD